MKKNVVVSGYFNPIHKGHIELFNLAKDLGSRLWVIVNNDVQREIKGSTPFYDEEERLLIVNSLKMVDYAMLSIDNDNTVKQSLKELHLKSIVEDPKGQLIFANGGDTTNESIPEADLCNHLSIKLVDGLGDKINSSSWLLNDHK